MAQNPLGGLSPLVYPRSWYWSQYFIFIHDLDDGAQFTLSKFIDDTKLGKAIDKPHGHALNQKDLAGYRNSLK